ncbi:response regulator [Pelosinus sp. sgz500959]|uniref:response regulator n=1 Tax=Pelosinus sp. sgz500959 TaxID=3242472 RepID=UPI00366B592E
MRNATVLFVDDEPGILNAIRRIVINENYYSLYADSGQKALEIMKTTKVSVLVADISMPGMDGLSLLRHTKEIYPDVVRIVLSGCTQIFDILPAINQGEVFRFITKPWGSESDLLAVLQQSLDYYDFCKERKNKESSLQQKNTAYQTLLRNFEEQFYSCNYDLGNTKVFLDRIFNYLMESVQTIDNIHSLDRLAGQIRLLKNIVNSYTDILPTILEKFTLSDVNIFLDYYIKTNIKNMQYSSTLGDLKEYTCFGNYKQFQFIMTTLFHLLYREGSKQNYSCTVSSEKLKESIRINNIINIGHVDGAQILIDQDELITYDSLNFYSTLLNQVGKFYNIKVTYTYINPNVSFLSIIADFSLQSD